LKKQLPADLLSLAEAHAQQPSPPNGPNQQGAQQADLAQLAQVLLGLSDEQRETIGQLMAREGVANPPWGQSK